MLNFYQLPSFCQSVFIAMFFLLVCAGIYLSSTIYFRRHNLPKILVPLTVLASGMITVLYATDLRVHKQNFLPVAAAEWFCGLPVWIPGLLLAITAAYYIYILSVEQNYRKTILTRSSVKEAVEKVSSGLCFYYSGGRVILQNNRVSELCHALVGRDLQNAEVFCQILSDGAVQPNVTHLTEWDNPTFRLPDGRVWMFAYEDLGGIHQLRATDITQLQVMTDELEENNVRLTALNQRLRKYGENVDELVRSRERLEIKARIHRELGQALLASRRYLLDDDGTQAAPLEQWQRNIAMLRRESQQQEELPLEMLTRIAKATGIRLETEGQWPADAKTQRLFVQATAEALTNAISHAQAKTLYIQLNQNEANYTARFSNDGIIPTQKIVEGGGLGSLRKKIERERGQMIVDHIPQFILTVTLPKERGEQI